MICCTALVAGHRITEGDTGAGLSGQPEPIAGIYAPLRVVKASEPLVRFEALAGQQLQCDWVVFRRGKSPLSAFVVTLGYSRASYVEFVPMNGSTRCCNAIRAPSSSLTVLCVKCCTTI